MVPRAWIWKNSKAAQSGTGLVFAPNQIDSALLIVQAGANASYSGVVGGWVVCGCTPFFLCGCKFFLEIVNYVRTRFLRKLAPMGLSEKMPTCTLGESTRVSNWFIFNTGKHCHHHRKPSAKKLRTGSWPMKTRYPVWLAGETSCLWCRHVFCSYGPPPRWAWGEGVLKKRVDLDNGRRILSFGLVFSKTFIISVIAENIMS